MKNRAIALILPLSEMILFWAITPVTIAWVKTNLSLTFQVRLRYLGSIIILWAAVLLNPHLRAELKVIKHNPNCSIIRILITTGCTISFQLF